MVRLFLAVPNQVIILFYIAMPCWTNQNLLDSARYGSRYKTAFKVAVLKLVKPVIQEIWLWHIIWNQSGSKVSKSHIESHIVPRFFFGYSANAHKHVLSVFNLAILKIIPFFIFTSICSFKKVLTIWFTRSVLDGKMTWTDLFAEFWSGDLDGGLALDEQYQRWVAARHRNVIFSDFT